jgi:hypothetical protein
MMKKSLAILSLAALIAAPGLASAAEEGAAAGAAAGAVTGGVVGGPVGAAVGAAVGGTVGGAASGPDRRDTVVVQPGAPAASTTRTCVTDSAGNQTCREVTR